MDIFHMAAFTSGDSGGNPAGVVLTDRLPSDEEMQKIAAAVGYSETAFAAPQNNNWRVRYFAPASEVPFCGHATIALGAIFASRYGNGKYMLILNDAKITVEGWLDGKAWGAALQSPPTRSRPAEKNLIATSLALFGYTENDLDGRVPPAIAEAGARHLILALKHRDALAAMRYDFEAGRALMNFAQLTTIALVQSEGPQLFHARNPFASGGIYEDPATGAAAAALAGYLRDLSWPHGGRIEIRQGEDMGTKSSITAAFSDLAGSSIRVTGTVRQIDVDKLTKRAASVCVN